MATVVAASMSATPFSATMRVTSVCALAPPPARPGQTSRPASSKPASWPRLTPRCRKRAEQEADAKRNADRHQRIAPCCGVRLVVGVDGHVLGITGHVLGLGELLPGHVRDGVGNSTGGIAEILGHGSSPCGGLAGGRRVGGIAESILGGRHFYYPPGARGSNRRLRWRSTPVLSL